MWLQVLLQPKSLLQLSNQEFIPAFWEDDTTSADAAAVSAAGRKKALKWRKSLSLVQRAGMDAWEDNTDADAAALREPFKNYLPLLAPLSAKGFGAGWFSVKGGGGYPPQFR